MWRDIERYWAVICVSDSAEYCLSVHYYPLLSKILALFPPSFSQAELHYCTKPCTDLGPELLWQYSPDLAVPLNNDWAFFTQASSFAVRFCSLNLNIFSGTVHDLVAWQRICGKRWKTKLLDMQDPWNWSDLANRSSWITLKLTATKGEKYLITGWVSHWTISGTTWTWWNSRKLSTSFPSIKKSIIVAYEGVWKTSG